MFPFPIDIIPSDEPNRAYIVGGSVRDLILERTPLDYDIAVLGDPESFASRMAAGISGHFVKLGKPGLTIFRIVSDDLIFDISAVTGSSIEDDLRRRDFTINALAYDINGGKIIDCVGGRQDLAQKTVRIVSPSVFKHDPVRLIRAYRMAANLGFNIDPETEVIIKKDAHLVTRSAGERQRAELYKILATTSSHQTISRMRSSGLLTTIFPELKDLQGCRQNRHHQFDVFDHTLKAFSHLEDILANIDSFVPGDSDPEGWSAAEIPVPALKLSLLLHDIGKPASRFVDANGHVHFYGHGKKSADMAKDVSQRLRLSKMDADYLDFIIRHHIRPLFLFTAHRRNKLTNRAVTRFFMKSGGRAPDLLLHCTADIMGKGNDDERNQAFITFAGELIRDYFSTFKARTSDPPLLNGHDLIHTFALRPSPLFKLILNRIEEERLSGAIGSKTEAEKLVREFLKLHLKPKI